MPFCKICHQLKKLVKCHILPDAIHKHIYDEAALEVSANNFPKRLQIGHYDDNLACKYCEKMFHQYDDYFIDFFKNIYHKSFDKITTNKYCQFTAHKYSNVKCGLLYGFFIFYLLRASLSEIEFYKNVSLGKKYHNLLISYLKRNNISLLNKLEIELIFFTYNKRTRIQKQPERARIRNLNTYLFFLPGGIEVLYKVDRQSWKFSPLCLKPNSTELITPVTKTDSIIEELHKNDLLNE